MCIENKYFRNILTFAIISILIILVQFNQTVLNNYPFSYLKNVLDIKKNQIMINNFVINEIFYESIYLKSKCYCKNDLMLRIYENYTEVYSDKDGINLKHLYNMTNDEFKYSNFTCDMYNSLRRGKSQKVIGYSLYGKNNFYYAPVRFP